KVSKPMNLPLRHLSTILAISGAIDVQWRTMSRRWKAKENIYNFHVKILLKFQAEKTRNGHVSDCSADITLVIKDRFLVVKDRFLVAKDIIYFFPYLKARYMAKRRYESRALVVRVSYR